MLFRFWVFPDCTFLDISKIIPMEITDDDISRIRKEVEESSAFKTDDPA